MATATIREGTHGGKSLLHASDAIPVDKELEEANEPLNLRNPDLLDTALSNALGCDIGGHVTNKLFLIPVFGSGDDDLEFDRFYFDHNLLTDYYAVPYNDEATRVTNEDIERRTKFAEANGCVYLPVIGGVMTVAQMQQVVHAIKKAKK